MAAFAWIMMGLALWHFTVFLPDRFLGGIVGAFVGALIGSVIFPFLVHGLSVPGQDATTILVAAEAIPGAVIGMAVIYWLGAREERLAAEDAELAEPA